MIRHNLKDFSIQEKEMSHILGPQLSQKIVPPPTVGEDSGGGEKV